MRFFIVFLTTLSILGCKGESMGEIKLAKSNLVNITQQQFEGLLNKKVYFGHQSVGLNIINGIRDIMKENPDFKLNIKETKNPFDFDSPVFAHSNIGQNRDPIFKIDDFKKIMDSGVGDYVDIAFFKFCYIDIREDVDIMKTFQYYVDTFSYLEAKYPKVKFLHFTVPFIVTPAGIKAKIKRMIGYSMWTDANNISRNNFNKLLIEKYGDKVFDLARFESTYPDGKREFFVKSGWKYYTFIAEYSSDEGHLNELGRKRIGEELLKFLLSKSR